MKRFRWSLVVVVCLSLVMLLLTGCISKSAYEDLQTEHRALVQENISLKERLEKVQSDLANLRAEYDKLTADYKALDEELFRLQGFCPPEYFLRPWY